MRIALDTNRVTDLFRGDIALSEELATCDEVWIPLSVIGEIKAGFYGGTQQRRNEVLLNGLLVEPTVAVLVPRQETAEHSARLFVQPKRAGTPIPDNDLWIAALVLEHNLLLVTRDKHFERNTAVDARVAQAQTHFATGMYFRRYLALWISDALRASSDPS